MKRKSLLVFFICALSLLSLRQMTFAAEVMLPSMAPFAVPASVERVESIETDTVSFKVNFGVGKSIIDPQFRDNAEVLSALNSFLGKMVADSTRRVAAMRICGSVSPEGPYKLNEQLVYDRAKALRAVIRQYLQLDNEKMARNLPTNIREVNEMAAAMAIPVSDLYSDLRFASVDFVVDTSVWTEYRHEQPEVTEVVIPAPAEPVSQPRPAVAPAPPSPAPRQERWHVKTNLIGWAMMVSNIAIERDFGNRLSVALPVYFSAMNYFTRTLKFRTITIQPELRYWFGDHSDSASRWFVGAHAGLGWYNYALKGDYRIQDAGANSPSWGGGLSAGYRMLLPWGSRNRWKMEFTLGIGVYDSKYDKWLNRADGPLRQGSIHRTFVGIDQAAVSIVYSF